MSKIQALRSVLFGLLAGAFCSGCDPNMGSPNGGPSAGQAGADETPDEGTGPAAGGTGGASPTGGATAYGGTESVPPAGSAGVPPTGGSSSGGESPAGAAGVIAQGGSDATGGYCCHQGGTEQTGGDSGMSGQAGEPATGGNLGTGGQTETGGEAGEPATGGTLQTGGNSGKGGEAGELATGGTVQTGGNSGTGGEAGEPASGGTSATGGTEETGGEGGDGEDGPYCVSPGEACDESLDGRRQCCAEKDGDVVECVDGICVQIPQPFACDSNWVRHELGTDLTGEGICFAADDCYVAHSMIGGPGKLSHYDGSEWSVVDLGSEIPGAYPIHRALSLSADEDGALWVGGNWNSGGVVPWAMLAKYADGVWSTETVPPMVNDVELVRSIWTGDGVVVVSADIYDGSENWDSYIYIKQNGSWTKMQTPSHEAPLSIRAITGFSADELYAVGGRLDTDMNWVDSVLWQYDGSEWSEVATLPSDIVFLGGVSRNADVELVVAGASHDGTSYQGVTLVTNDLVNWQRNDTGSDGDSATWSPRLGAALVASTSGTSTPGSARLQVSSEGVWTTDVIGGSAAGISGIWSVPGTNQVMLATQASTGHTAVYVGTCQ